MRSGYSVVAVSSIVVDVTGIVIVVSPLSVVVLLPSESRVGSVVIKVRIVVTAYVLFRSKSVGGGTVSLVNASGIVVGKTHCVVGVS